MLMFRNYETYALVTGAASGMGRIYALRLAQKGYNIVLVDINAAGLGETEAMVRAAVSADERIDRQCRDAFKVLPLVQDLSVMDAADSIWERTEQAGCVVEV